MLKKISLMVLLLLCVLAGALPVQAAVSDDSVIDAARPCTIEIRYQETVEGNDPVAGAEFTAYQIAAIDPQGGYDSMIEGMDISPDKDAEELLAVVRKAFATKQTTAQRYVKTTGQDGRAVFSEVAQGVYLIEETKPAADHLAAIPFFAMVPYVENNAWNYTLTAEPKSLPTGGLKLTKTVKGKTIDRKKAFRFTVTFPDFHGTATYVKSDKTSGTLKSGESIALKHKEQVEIRGLPVGTNYKIKENTSDAADYLVIASGEEGTIRRKHLAEVSFVNSQTTPKTGDDRQLFFACMFAVAAFLLLSSVVVLLLRQRKEG